MASSHRDSNWQTLQLARVSGVMQMVQTVLWVSTFKVYLLPFLLLGILLAGVATTATVAHRQKVRLAAVFRRQFLVPRVTRGYVRAVKASQLVPGDVIVVQPGMAVCDLVLLRGTCLVEDASLTGEVCLLNVVHCVRYFGKPQAVYCYTMVHT